MILFMKTLFTILVYLREKFKVGSYIKYLWKSLLVGSGVSKRRRKGTDETRRSVNGEYENFIWIWKDLKYWQKEEEYKRHVFASVQSGFCEGCC